MASFAGQLSQTARMWRSAVAPLAEWLAQTLWSSIRKSRKEHGPATRLADSRAKPGSKGPFVLSGSGACCAAARRVSDLRNAPRTRSKILPAVFSRHQYRADRGCCSNRMAGETERECPSPPCGKHATA